MFQMLTAAGGRFSFRELTNAKTHPSRGPRKVSRIASELDIWPVLEPHPFNCLSISVSVQGLRAQLGM
jgi:hypothetical protein